MQSHQVARALTESSRQQPDPFYIKRSLQAMLNKISPVPHETKHRLTIRKHCSGRHEILTSSLFKIKLEEKRQEKIDKADQQKKN
jgi:hypothetical protein